MLFLVPAHDEALLIEECVTSLMRMTATDADFRVVVIADNCSDDTAARARACGAQVLERTNPLRRGKPHAIEWAMSLEKVGEYDAVVIIDADTHVARDFADVLAAYGPLKDKAVQAYFGLSNESDSWLSRLAGLLSRIRYEGQYPMRQRANFNCALTGNGMCLGSSLLGRLGWAPDALTENWELYARYTVYGARIEYAQDARLFSQEASSLKQSGTQRKRWQSGRLAALRMYAGELIRRPGLRMGQRIDAIAELSSLGPVLHSAGGIALGVGLLFLPNAVAQAFGAIFMISVLPMVGWTADAWIRSPDRLAIMAALLRLPIYVLWRAGVATKALIIGGKLGWERSPRSES